MLGRTPSLRGGVVSPKGTEPSAGGAPAKAHVAQSWRLEDTETFPLNRFLSEQSMDEPLSMDERHIQYMPSE